MDLWTLSRRVVFAPLLALIAVWACSGKVETSTGRKPVSSDPDSSIPAPCTGSGCRDAGATSPRDEDAGWTSPPYKDSGRPDDVPECTIDPETHAVVLDRADFCSPERFGVEGCTATMETVLEGYTCSATATETSMTRTVGCGIVTVAMNGGFTGTTWHFDEATGELVGMEFFTDVATGPCDTGAIRWGRGRGPCFDVVEQGCRRVPVIRDAGKPTPPQPTDAGAVTPCNGPGDDAPCLAAGATCWDEPWTVAACAEVFDPLCACPGGTCACWGQFGMGPPYPDSPATTCDSIEDTTTCASASALCMSVHANLADPCTEFATPVCDCDDHPCRCWANERSRVSR